MRKVYIGADPGISGAIALLDEAGVLLEAWDVPTMADGKKNQINAAELSKELGRYSDYHLVAIVEKVGAMPGQGVASMFNFGKSFGVLLGVLGAIGAETHLVTPATWKKHYSLIGKDKDCSRTLAQQYYPAASLGRKKDHGKADALLLARYGQTL